MMPGKERFKFIVFLLILLSLGFIGCRKGTSSLNYEWVTIDENYVPQNYIESFIKNDSESQGLLPVYIKNYDQNQNVLHQFRGTLLAKPNQAALRMTFPGLEEWMLVDLKYENEKMQEVLRTVLYVKTDGVWKVGDSGRLLE